VKSYFEEQNCVLLSTNYENSDSKLDYICSCGNKSSISFGNFKGGHKCANCGGSKKLTYQYVKSYFKKENCVLLSSRYKNNQTKLCFICSCENESIITFANFQQGQRCKKCGIKRTHDKQKHSYDYVKSFFEKQGCVLLSEKYKNTHQKLNYICSCGNHSSISFTSFLQGHKCRKCGTTKSTNTKIASGFWYNDKYKDKFELYRNRISSKSESAYRNYKSEINPLKLKRGNGHYHLDHRLSVFDGFKNNIPVFLMSSPHNLEMLSEKENVRKHKNSSITKEQLFELFYKELS
jgi:hypothetical protein